MRAHPELASITGVLACALGLQSAFAADESSSASVAAPAFLDYNNVTVDGEELANGTEARLVRIDVTGEWEGYSFVGSIDFGGSDTNIQDLYAEFAGGETTYRFGNFKVMNGLEATSSEYSKVFMEGASIAKVNDIGRRLGFGAFHSFGDFNLSGGLFATNINDQNDEDGWSASGRLTWSRPLEGDGSVLHLGASTRYRQAGDSEGPLSFAGRPHAHMAPKTINTSYISDSDLFLGVEAAAVLGGFSLQGEYGQTIVDCAMGLCADDPTFESGYVDASYMWGGQRYYNRELGVFKRDRVFNPVGEGGPGAFALSARYDFSDLNDGLIMGGSQRTAILGASYYRDNYVRLMLNYANADLDDSPYYGDETVQSLTARAQIEFH